MKLKDKYRQIKKEAGACVIALLVLIVFWAIADLASAIWISLCTIRRCGPSPAVLVHGFFLL